MKSGEGGIILRTNGEGVSHTKIRGDLRGALSKKQKCSVPFYLPILGIDLQ
jgi:hypothetical protein